MSKKEGVKFFQHYILLMLSSLAYFSSSGQLTGQYCTMPNMTVNCLTFKDSLRFDYYEGTDNHGKLNSRGVYFLDEKDSVVILNLLNSRVPVAYNIHIDSSKISSDSSEVSIYAYIPFLSYPWKWNNKSQIPLQYAKCQVFTGDSILMNQFFTDYNGLATYKWKNLSDNNIVTIYHDDYQRFHRTLTPGWKYNVKIWYGWFNKQRNPTIRQIIYKIGKVTNEYIELKPYPDNSFPFEKYYKKL